MNVSFIKIPREKQMNLIEHAQRIVAECWQDKETMGIPMDTRPAKAFTQRLAACLITGAEEAERAEFWRNLVPESVRELAEKWLATQASKP